MKNRVFVASSRESLPFADAIRKHLADVADVQVWDDCFALSVTVIDGLFKNLGRADFGIFILSADDALTFRNQEYLSARDNVIFELGLFMGRLGRERTFFLVPKNLSTDRELRLPSDLQGLVYATFDPSEGALTATREACQQIQRQIGAFDGENLYQITNRTSCKCLDVAAWKRSPGAKIVQWGYHGGANQLWRLERIDDQFYGIRSSHSGLFLTVPGENEGAQVEQRDLRRGDGRQQWEFINLPGGSYRISPRFDGALCLAVAAGSCDNGAAIVVSDWKHEADHEWWLNRQVVLDPKKW